MVLFAILHLAAITVEELPRSSMSITSVLSAMDKTTRLHFLVADSVAMFAYCSCCSYVHTFTAIMDASVRLIKITSLLPQTKFG